MSSNNTDNQWNVQWQTTFNQYAVLPTPGGLLPNPVIGQVANPGQHHSLGVANSGWNANNMQWYQQTWPQQQPWMANNYQIYPQQGSFVSSNPSVYIPQNPQPQYYDAASTVNNLGIGDKQFQSQLKEWEQNFQKWKEENKNHPDKNALAQYEAQWKSWRDQLLQTYSYQAQAQSQQPAPGLYNQAPSQMATATNQAAVYPTAQAYIPAMTPQLNTQYHFPEGNHARDLALQNYMDPYPVNQVDNHNMANDKPDEPLFSSHIQRTELGAGIKREALDSTVHMSRNYALPSRGAFHSEREDSVYLRHPNHASYPEDDHYSLRHAYSRWRNNDFSHDTHGGKRYCDEEPGWHPNYARTGSQQPRFEERGFTQDERFPEYDVEDAAQQFKKRALKGKNQPSLIEKRHTDETKEEKPYPRSRIEERLALYAGTKLNDTPAFQPDRPSTCEPQPSDGRSPHPIPKQPYEPTVFEYHHQSIPVKQLETFCLDYCHGKKGPQSPSAESQEKALISEAEDTPFSAISLNATTEMQGSVSQPAQPAQLFPSAAAIDEDCLLESRTKIESAKAITEGVSGQDSAVIPKESYEESQLGEEMEAVMIEDLLLPPGRFGRPEKILIILRGVPASGKSHLARLIKEKETAMGGSAPRILSIDDYYVMIDDTGPLPWNQELEEQYRMNLLKSLKRNLDDGHFSFFIVDALHLKASEILEVSVSAKERGFATFLVELEQSNYASSTRKCSDDDLETMKKSWEEAPKEIPCLDVSWFFKEKVTERTPSPDDKVTSTTSNYDEDSQGSSSGTPAVSKWEMMEQTEEKLDRLDGIVKGKVVKHTSVEDWLQSFLSDEYMQRNSASGKKRVRWADIEEKIQQEKMRDMGFVVGHTDWSRMTSSTTGESALTQTKYIYDT